MPDPTFWSRVEKRDGCWRWIGPNRGCVNPAHMEPVTSAENTRRAIGTPAQKNAAKTECPQGHPYDDANTYTHTPANGRPRRYCRACNREAVRRLKQRRAA